jgi:histidinol phosphatase-like enzyme
VKLPEDIQLLLFDIDGTIVHDYNATEILPGRKEFLESIRSPHPPWVHEPFVAFITNQGGVGLRYWMEKQSWGEPEKYPEIHDVSTRLNKIFTNLGIKNPALYICYCYQNKNGIWGPTPYDELEEWRSAPYTWQPRYRKPSPGMIDLACEHYRIKKNKHVLYVGDREEDRLAAASAWNGKGIPFVWAKEFFME